MVKDELKPMGLTLTSNLEAVGAQVTLRTCKLTVLVVYLPPPLNQNLLDNLDSLLNEVSALSRPKDKIIIMGDFNTTHYNPLQAEELDANNITQKFVTCFSATGCKQYVNFPTCNNHFLDHVWSNTTIHCEKGVNVLSSIHEALNFSLPAVPSARVCNNVTTDFNFQKTDWDECKSLLTNVDWADTLSDKNVDRNWSRFYTHVNDVITITVPKKARKTKHS
jgi:hypothetical protein